ncbi:MAG: Ig-like domain-containing protein [Solobacterium sp.]|nr:Ig-like domain-containing protein [Solobacterium sp.]
MRNKTVQTAVLSAFLALGGIPPGAGDLMNTLRTQFHKVSFYAETEETETRGEIPDDFTVPHVREKTSGGRKGNRDIPSAYDSRQSGLMTPAKDQGDTQICWAFSAVSCAETAAVRNGYTDAPDYSEHHLAYFFPQTVYQKTGICGADSTYYIDEDYLQSGGNNRYTSFALANWTGIAEETSYPFDEPWGDEAYQNRNAVDDVLHMTSADWIPMTDTAFIKKRIMERGCVSASLYYRSSYYSEETSAYYNDRYTATNHAVVLAGWDDSFPADRFNTEPEGNGAWLVKTSWGTDFGDQGYFWVSYYDKAVSFSGNTAIAFEFEPAGQHDNLYYYDGSCGTRTYSIENGGSIAGIFTACADADGRDEELTAVGIAFSESGLNYSISVYTDLDDGNDPASGTAALDAAVTGTTECAGYQMIPLPQPVKLLSGKTFSIVAVLEQPGAETVTTFVDTTYENGNWIGFRNETAPGQSFAGGTDNSWTDLHELNYSVRIKACTNTLPTAELQGVRFAEDTVVLKTGETGGQSCIPVPIAAECNDISWTSSDETVAVIDENGIVEAKAGGETVITAETGGFSASYTVSVIIPLEGIAFEQELVTLHPGESQRVILSGMPKEQTEYSDLMHEAVWSSSDPSVAEVSEDGTITAVQTGKAEINASIPGKYISASIIADVREKEKADQDITVKSTASVLSVGESAVISVTGAKGNKSYRSSNTGIATVSSSGQVTAKKPGTVTITVSVSETENYKPASKTVKIKVVPAATAKVATANKAGGVKVAWKKVAGATGYYVCRNGVKAKTVTDGNTLSWGDTKATVNGGKYTYKIIAYADTGKSTLSKEITTYWLSRPVISSLANTAAGKVTVKWGRNTKASGYQVQCSTNSGFSSDTTRTATIRDISTVSKVIGNLKKGTTCYIRVRSFLTKDGKNYYSMWSVVKNLKLTR